MDKQEQLICDFRKVFNKMSWLNAKKMKDELSDYKPSEVHCIEYIGKNKAPNVKTLSNAFYMTRGAISKLTKKLMEKGLIESYQREDNKKEIYFTLTKKGQEAFDIHERLHEQFSQRDKAVFENVSDEQFCDMLELIKKYDEHLNEQIKKSGIDVSF